MMDGALMPFGGKSHDEFVAVRNRGCFKSYRLEMRINASA
jgi:hypothetical protein